MKTKFLKKLSFVLAVAMVLSVLYPAAGVFAAAKPKLNATSKYLHLDVDGLNEFDFNISNKQKGWKYDWESANENVVTVDSKGVVTAVGVGKTKVTVYITDKDGEEVARLSATVTVRDNIKEVKISNPPEGALAVGQEHDFNRSFVTRSGSKNKTSSITRWEVTPADGATIDDKGLFVATKAGTYTVIARSFQSKARYESWLKDKETYKEYVLDDDSVEVTVKASIKEVKQVDVSTVDVLFDSPVEDAAKNISVYQVVGSAKVKQIVKEVKVNDDKTKATVSVYVPFVGGSEYLVEYTGMDPKPFTAATTKVSDVVAIEITTTTAVLNQATPVEFKLLNAAGVDITTTELANRVTMKSSGGVGTFFDANSKKVTIFTKDASTTITATFHTYDYDSTGKEKTVEGSAVIVGVPADATTLAGMKAWTIVKSGAPDFDDVNHVLALDDNGARLFVKFKTKVGSKDGDDVDSYSTPGKFEFVSSDKNVLIVSANGFLYPVKEGDVTVVVYYGDAGSREIVDAIPLTVGAKRKATSLSVSKTSFDLSNASFGDTAQVEIKVKDQYGADFNFTQYKVEKLDGSPTTGTTNVTPTGTITLGSAASSATINFRGFDRDRGQSMTVGTYYYKVTVADLVAIISVNVLDGSGTVSSYRLELGATSVDLKAESGKINKDIDIVLYGYNNKGVKAAKCTIDNDTYKLTITAPKDNSTWDYPTGSKYNPATFKYSLASGVSGSAIVKAPVGTYEVKADVKIDGNWVPVDVQYFTVTDSQPVPVVAEIKTQTFTNAVSGEALNLSGDTESNNASLIAAVRETVKFTLNGNEVTNIVSVKANGTATEFSIISVTIREYIDGAYIDHKVNVGLTVWKK